ncbi:DUF3034 family protein [Mangrovimicrobium sediminis]|nr:DUF3034 family protein [Haliea sp. SAOS-164]
MRRLLSSGAIALLLSATPCLAGGKLLATPGVSQFEGAAGGGLVPWAQLAGYATENEVAFSGYCTRVDVDDFTLDTCGAQFNLFDRLELSYAEQRLDVQPLTLELEQKIAGFKLRLAGDLVYSPYPQVSLGVMHKQLDDAAVPYALGAQDDTGTDIYLAVSKLHLGVLAGYNLLWNITARRTEANEAGLLGYGAADASPQLLLEGSVAVLLDKRFALGVEYREKPDNLGLGEDDWRDLFVAWFPNKHLSVTAAWVDLGRIAAIEGQDGWYLSIMGYY